MNTNKLPASGMIISLPWKQQTGEKGQSQQLESPTERFSKFTMAELFTAPVLEIHLH